MRNEFNYDILTTMYAIFVRNYRFFINVFNDLIIINTFGLVYLFKYTKIILT